METSSESQSSRARGPEEEQPLLPNTDRRHPTPLPKVQVAAVCLSRLGEPIAFTQILPYLNQMIEELHISKNPQDIGFYSGIIGGLIGGIQLFTMYQWGRLSDRIGRKPVVAIGLTGVAISSFGFGLSKTFTQMVISRGIAGLMTGNVGVIQSIMGDISDETNQGIAFSLSTATWNIGAMIGPLIGGVLYHPAERYPSVFGGVQFLRDWPFFLPCFVSFLITACGVLIALFILKESLPSKVHPKRISQRLSPPESPKTYGTVIGQQESTVATQPSRSTSEILSDKRIFRLLMVALIRYFHTYAFKSVFILWVYTPVEYGGLQQKSSDIGYALAAEGLLGIVLSLFGFPALYRLMDPQPLLTFTMSMYVVVAAFALVLNMFATVMSTGLPFEGPTLVVLWIGLALILIMGRVATLANPANTIVLRMSSPDENLGGIFGLMQTVACLGEAIGPSLGSSIFALTIGRGPVASNLVWLILLGNSILGVWVTVSVKNL